MLVFDTPPVSRDYTYERQSRLIDSQSASSRQAPRRSRETSATARKSPETTSKLIRAPNLTTRRRDAQAYQQTDRQTDSETAHEYCTIDDVRRETAAYCVLTTAGDAKRMTHKPTAPSEPDPSQSSEKDYETLPDTALGQPHTSGDDDLSPVAAGGEMGDGERKSPGGKRGFCYRLFARSISTASSSAARTLPRRSKSLSPRRIVSSKTLARC